MSGSLKNTPVAPATPVASATPNTPIPLKQCTPIGEVADASKCSICVRHSAAKGFVHVTAKGHLRCCPVGLPVVFDRTGKPMIKDGKKVKVCSFGSACTDSGCLAPHPPLAGSPAAVPASSKLPAFIEPILEEKSAPGKSIAYIPPKHDISKPPSEDAHEKIFVAPKTIPFSEHKRILHSLTAGNLDTITLLQGDISGMTVLIEAYAKVVHNLMQNCLDSNTLITIDPIYVQKLFDESRLYKAVIPYEIYPKDESDKQTCGEVADLYALD